MASFQAALDVRLERRYGPGNAEREKSINFKDKMPAATIYKICPASAWRDAERQGVYRGSADDRRDGFIHFSATAQVEGTLARHFAGQAGLFLIAIDAGALGDKLKWEPSRGGELFPHLYGDLDLGAVTDIFSLAMRADGSHIVPELVP